MNPPMWTPEDQFEIWARNVGEATSELMRMLADPRDLHNMAFDRLKSGLLVFKGDARWAAMSEGELGYESLEEGGDMLNYKIWEIEKRRQRNG